MELQMKDLMLIGIGVMFALGFLYYTNPEALQGLMGQWVVNQDVGVETGEAGTEAGGTTTTQTTGETAMPKYQLSTVNIYLMDKLNPKAGIPNIEIEVLEAPSEPYTYADLVAIASDPMRSVVDEDTATDSSGKANFTSGRIFVGKDYIYSVRGDSTVYDKVVVKKVPVPSTQFKIDTWTFEDKLYDYYVGSFKDINYTGNSDKNWNCDDTSAMNVSGKTGQQYTEFNINIGEADSGKALKNPVLVLRSPTGYELEPGDIISLYITRYSGTAFNIPGTNLADYIDVAPIELGGSVYDSDMGTYLMTVSDAGVYTVKITYDADQIQSTDKLQICLDDLGDYRAKDDVTKDLKASAECMTVDWCGESS